MTEPDATADEPRVKRATFRSRGDRDYSEPEEEGDVVLIVVLVIVGVITLAVIILLFTHFITKRNKHKVTILDQDIKVGVESAFDHNSTVPRESEEDRIDSKRDLRKNSERGTIEDTDP